MQDHGFNTGDFVTYEYSGSASEQIVGLEDGRTYRVVKIDDTNFELTDLDGNAIADYGAVTGFGDGDWSKISS